MKAFLLFAAQVVFLKKKLCSIHILRYVVLTSHVESYILKKLVAVQSIPHIDLQSTAHNPLAHSDETLLIGVVYLGNFISVFLELLNQLL